MTLSSAVRTQHPRVIFIPWLFHDYNITTNVDPYKIWITVAAFKNRQWLRLWQKRCLRTSTYTGAAELDVQNATRRSTSSIMNINQIRWPQRWRRPSSNHRFRPTSPQTPVLNMEPPLRYRNTKVRSGRYMMRSSIDTAFSTFSSHTTCHLLQFAGRTWPQRTNSIMNGAVY